MYPEQYLPAPITPGRFEVAVDGSFVRVTGTCLWTVATVDTHFLEMSAILRAIRTSYGHATVLVDLRQAPVQPAVVMGRLAHWTGTIFTARDRVALVVASSLVKVQMRRIDIAATRELFVSSSAAELWLRAPFCDEVAGVRVA